MLKLKLQYFGHLMRRVDSLEKTLMLGKIEGRRVTEDEMVGWHHLFNGHESEQTPGDSEGQGSLVCCSPWGCRVGHDLATDQQQQSVIFLILFMYYFLNNVMLYFLDFSRSLKSCVVSTFEVAFISFSFTS